VLENQTMNPQKTATARQTSSNNPKRGLRSGLFTYELLNAFWGATTAFDTFIHGFEFFEILGLLVAGTGLVVTNIGI